MNRTFLIGLAALFVAGGVLSIVTAYTIHKRRNSTPKAALKIVYDHGDWQQERLLTDFILTDQDGTTFKSEKMKDRICIVSFFFAMCPSVCARQNQSISLLQDELAAQGVHFISITCDPENDTPDILKIYSDKFTKSNEHWTFLTGELTHIRRIGVEVFGVPLAKATHTSHLLLVDKWGKVRGRYAFDKEDQVSDMRGLIPKLQKETEPPPPAKPKKRRKPNIRLDDDDGDDDDDDDKSKGQKENGKKSTAKAVQSK